MAHINITQNNFSAGEVNPIYYGRKDLALHLNGAKRLINLDISPSGSLHARAGTRLVRDFSSAPLLHKCITKEDKYFLLVFDYSYLYIYDPKEKIFVQDYYWPDLFFLRDKFGIAHGENLVIICHPDKQPTTIDIHKIPTTTTTTTTATVADTTPITTHVFTRKRWQADTDDKGQYLLPYERFAESDISLRVVRDPAGGKNSDADKTDKYIVTSSRSLGLTAKQLLLQRFYINGSHGPFEVELTEAKFDATGKLKADCKLIHGNPGNKTSTDWVEPVFSYSRGWPGHVCFHQGRLVFAKTDKDKSRLWMSKTGKFGDFSLGEGRDDEAIDITLSNDFGTDILHLLSGRHLQIFTAGGEWVIPNEVITPSNIEARRRTAVGALETKRVHPVNINGITIFCDAINKEFNEYTYTEVEDSYIVNNLSRLAPPLAATPVATDYDKINRRLCCVLENGEMRILWLFTEEKILGWSSYETVNGLFRDYINCKDDNFVVVERQETQFGGKSTKTYSLEQFSPIFKSDCTQKPTRRRTTRSGDTGTFTVNAFFQQQPLEMYAEDAQSERPHHIKHFSSDESTDLLEVPGARWTDQSTFKNLQLAFSASDGLLDNTNYTDKMHLGFAMEVAIEALPPNLTSQKVQHRYRLMEAIFDVQGTPQVQVDSGLGYRIVEGCDQGSEEHKKIKVSGCGWKNVGTDTPWKIRQYAAPNFSLLGAEMHLSVN